MPIRFIRKFGDYLILFLILQFQLSIKGSSAIPGNVQMTESTEMNFPIPSTLNPQPRSRSPQPVNNTEKIEESKPENCEPDFNLNFEKESESPDSNEKRKETVHEYVSESSPTVQLSLGAPVPVKSLRPKVSKSALNIHSNSKGDLAEEEELDFVKLANSLFVSNIRTSVFSRQSHSVTSGLDTPMTDDWIDLEINSMISGTSSVAKRLNENTGIVKNEEIVPIDYDKLCLLLEATADKRMSKEELLWNCKRIIAKDETLLLAWKNLPIFMATINDKFNAKSILSILELYKRKKEAVVSLNDENDLGSDDSRCPFEENYSIKSNLSSPMHSDGIVEASDSEHVFSADEFLNAWRKNSDLPPGDRIDACLNEIFSFSSNLGTISEYPDEGRPSRPDTENEEISSSIQETDERTSEISNSNELIETSEPETAQKLSNAHFDRSKINAAFTASSPFGLKRYKTFVAFQSWLIRETMQMPHQRTTETANKTDNTETGGLIEVD